MGALTRNTIVGVKAETTEGTYAAPLAADLMHIVDLPGINPSIDKLDRGVFKGSLGVLKPIKGMKAGTLEIKTEMRGGGVSAGVSQIPDWDALAKSAFGSAHTGTNSTTIAGSTQTVIKLGSGQGANFVVGAVVFIAGEVRHVQSISGDDLTLNEALVGSAPGSGVAVKAGRTYRLASSGHDHLSVAIWQEAETSGKEFRGLGCKVTSLAFEDFTVGSLPRLAWGLEMLNFSEVIGTSPVPTFDAQLPAPVIFGRATKGEATVAVGTVELEMAQTVSREKDVNTDGGVIRMFVTGREVTGSINPFVDKTSVTFFDNWRNNDSFELFFLVGQRDSSNLLVQGSVVSAWMPNNIFTEYGKEDLDGSLVHALGFQAHEAGAAGDDEIYLGVI